LALWEAGSPHELDPRTLETRGVYDFDGKLQGPMTAHPKTDPDTGELLFFGYSPFPPYLRYYVASADGKITRSEEIEVPVPTMMHDFIATRNHVIFMVFPATFRLENFASGAPIRWEPELRTKIGVMPRNGTSADVRWFETDPCYVFHPMNAYAENGQVIADVCRFDRLPLFDGAEVTDLATGNSAKLTRWTLDLRSGTVKERLLDDSPAEFPRLDERYAGLMYRYGYSSGRCGVPTDGGFFNAIFRYDHQTGKKHVCDFGPAGFPSEPIFVPRSARSPEGRGYLLSVVYREPENRSELVILDAENVEHKPLASVKLPHRIPYGFHGNWGQGL
jgi:carotenoid cleavage dioxygenase-like enzyme